MTGASIWHNVIALNPADSPFLHLALDGKADCLVTGDKDLRVLSDAFACQILSAEAFLANFLPHR